MCIAAPWHSVRPADSEGAFQSVRAELEARTGVRAAVSMMLGDNHVGPEYLLPGLARNSSGTAGAAIHRLGITDLSIHTAIQNSTPAPSRA